MLCLPCMQDLDADAQRLIYPILRLKMVQHILFSALKEYAPSNPFVNLTACTSACAH